MSKMGCPTWVRGKIVVGPLRHRVLRIWISVREAGLYSSFIGYWFAGIPVNPIPGLIGAARLAAEEDGEALHRFRMIFIAKTFNGSSWFIESGLEFIPVYVPV